MFHIILQDVENIFEITKFIYDVCIFDIFKIYNYKAWIITQLFTKFF